MVYTDSLVLQDYSKGTDTTGTARFPQFLLFYKIIPREQILQGQHGIHIISLVLQDYSKGTDATGTAWYTQFLLFYKTKPGE